MTNILTFFVEIVSRFAAKTPWFFKVVQVLAIVTAIVTGLPAFLTSVGIVLPEFLNSVMSTAVSISAIVAAFIAQLTVTSPEKIRLALRQD